MFKIGDSSIAEKHFTELGNNVKAVSRWLPGVQTLALDIYPNNLNVYKIEEISKILNIPIYTVYSGEHLLLFQEALLVKTQYGRVSVMYNTVSPLETTGILLSIIDSPKDLIVYESEDEVAVAKLRYDLNIEENKLRSIEHFLADPWKSYRAKEKSYKQKLVKAKATTEKEIERSKKAIVAVKAGIDEIREKIAKYLVGEKENREGD